MTSAIVRRASEYIIISSLGNQIKNMNVAHIPNTQTVFSIKRLYFINRKKLRLKKKLIEIKVTGRNQECDKQNRTDICT